MVFASKVASIAHELAMRHSRSGVTEYQLQSIIEGFFSYAGASGWSYPSIVGCGENATILHYTTNQDVCGDDEVILIDAGAEMLAGTVAATHSDFDQTVKSCVDAPTMQLEPCWLKDSSVWV